MKKGDIVTLWGNNGRVGFKINGDKTNTYAHNVGTSDLYFGVSLGKTGYELEIVPSDGIELTKIINEARKINGVGYKNKDKYYWRLRNGRLVRTRFCKTVCGYQSQFIYPGLAVNNKSKYVGTQPFQTLIGNKALPARTTSQRRFGRQGLPQDRVYSPPPKAPIIPQHVPWYSRVWNKIRRVRW